MLIISRRFARHTLGTLAAIFIAFAPQASSALEARPETPLVLSEERLARIKSHFQGYIDDKRLVGLTTAIAKNGETVHFETYGHRDFARTDATTRNTIYRIYSMTKPVAAVALMMLYEEGKFQLDDPLSDYLPAFKEQKVFAGTAEDGSLTYVPADKPITIRHLLTHTAGMTYGLFSDTPVDTLYRNANLFWAPETMADAMDDLAALPLLFQPGTRWHYSVSVDVQGRLIEILSGQKLEDFFEERIFQPLGMTDTAFYVPADKQQRFSDIVALHPETGELMPYEGLLEFDFKTEGGPKIKSAGGGLVSSTDDYMRFSLMLLGGGALDGVRLLKPETITLMTRDHLGPEIIANSAPAVTGEWGFGLGFAVVLDPDITDGLASVGEYNWGGAASTVFWVDPKENLVAMVMTNLVPSSTYKLREEMRALIYGALPD